jgi:hypothetical protein
VKTSMNGETEKTTDLDLPLARPFISPRGVRRPKGSRMPKLKAPGTTVLRPPRKRSTGKLR